MLRRFNVARAFALIACLAHPALAQLGTIPEKSPFRDVEYNHEWTFFTGYLTNGGDPAGVAPGGGPLVGLRYDYHFSGPLYGYARFTEVGSSRIALNPGKPLAKRLIGDYKWPMTFFDVGLETSLTGQKAWHNLMPVMSFGVGAYSDFINGPDVGGFSVGSGLMFTFGGGVRYAPANKRWQLRAEAYNYFYSIEYPPSYENAPPGGSTSILPAGAKGGYRSNWSLQIGASYTLIR